MDPLPTAPRRDNRLALEKSPYLLQHAHNPVDWYPWGAEAFARARTLDRPLFVSIGYSTCHWCHVMERESFEDEATAARINADFVAVKVDREERPDVDELYMAFVQSLTGQGGWPLNVWLTPALQPFYGGTYFPPDERFGRPSFAVVLAAIASAWRERNAELRTAASDYTGALAKLTALSPGTAAPEAAVLEGSYSQLRRLFDAQLGGFGGAPKFPRADFGALCLRVFHRSGDPHALHMACRTLDAMADGGIYDHLGGGFARYSTDARWLVPHFEKMLYDNAQLAFHYLEAHQLTGSARYAQVARETLDYVVRDLKDPTGAFHSAEDADSEGEEGRYYVWEKAEITRLLPAALADLFADCYGVTEGGNFEGRNILHRARPWAEAARAHGMDQDELERRLAEARAVLLTARQRRVRPHRDDKVLTGWNGLMIQALARGAVVLAERRYADAAGRAAEFLLATLRTSEGLLRRYRAGEAAIAAGSEEYACLVRGLLELYQCDFALSHARAAAELHQEMVDRFADPADGALFSAAAQQDDVIVRIKTSHDGALPSASSVAAGNALLLHELTGDERYLRQARAIAQAFAGPLHEHPLSLATLVAAVDGLHGERVQLVLAGDPAAADTRELAAAARRGFHPQLSISLAPTTDVKDAAAATALLAPLAGRRAGPAGAAAAYVCRGFACREPVHAAAALERELGLTRAAAG